MPKIMLDLETICQELRAQQRQRSEVMKSVIMQTNRLRSLIAGRLMDEAKKRGEITEEEASPKSSKGLFKKYLEDASGVLARVTKDETVECPIKDIVLGSLVGIKVLNKVKKDFEKEMLSMAKSLPVCEWVEHKDQLGFGVLSLAIVIGETGNLNNYDSPCKVWRRMGCAPWTYDGKTAMGCTWRVGKEGKLPALEWETYGYSPRRRSIAYLIGEGLMKLNLKSTKEEDEDGEETKTIIWRGPYRQRYEDARVSFLERHPEYSGKRCQLHGMLLATKLLLKNLWNKWHKKVEPRYRPSKNGRNLT